MDYGKPCIGNLLVNSILNNFIYFLFISIWILGWCVNWFNNVVELKKYLVYYWNNWKHNNHCRYANLIAYGLTFASHLKIYNDILIKKNS